MNIWSSSRASVDLCHIEDFHNCCTYLQNHLVRIHIYLVLFAFCWYAYLRKTVCISQSRECDRYLTKLSPLPWRGVGEWRVSAHIYFSSRWRWLVSFSGYCPWGRAPCPQVTGWFLHQKMWTKTKISITHFGYFSLLWVSWRTQEDRKCLKWNYIKINK